MRLITALMVMIMCGCSTFMTREDPGSWGEFYPSVKGDISGIAWFNDGNPGEYGCFMLCIYSMFILDIPISAITDTVLLPVDVVIMMSEDEEAD